MGRQYPEIADDMASWHRDELHDFMDKLQRRHENMGNPGWVWFLELVDNDAGDCLPYLVRLPNSPPHAILSLWKLHSRSNLFAKQEGYPVMPGFYLYVSNRLENLAIALASQLNDSSGAVFGPETVIVNSKGMERWLSLEIARHNGICANILFPFPKAFIFRNVFEPILKGLSRKTELAFQKEWESEFNRESSDPSVQRCFGRSLPSLEKFGECAIRIYQPLWAQLQKFALAADDAEEDAS